MVKIGELNQIKEVLKKSDLGQTSAETADFIFARLLDVLHRQCLGDAREFAKNLAKTSSNGLDGVNPEHLAADT